MMYIFPLLPVAFPNFAVISKNFVKYFEAVSH